MGVVVTRGRGNPRSPPAGDDAENEQVPEGKSKEGSTGDAATGVQTRSRASTSTVKKAPIKVGGKRKLAPDDVEGEAKKAPEGESQESPAGHKG